MDRFLPTAALAAALALSGCAGGDATARRELASLQAELAALRAEHEKLSRRVDGVSARVDVVSSRARDAAPASAEPRAAATAAPLVPEGLAVVRVTPASAASAAPRARRPATPPPLPTDVPIVEPDGTALDEIARRSGRELAAEATAELRAARRRSGLDRAHALEDFAARYPRHPEADNALVEAAASYAGEDRLDPSCALARRAADEYPAGDAMSDSLERLAWCESRRGAPEAERRLLERLVQEYPASPAAARAGERLAASKRSVP